MDEIQLRVFTLKNKLGQESKHNLLSSGLGFPDILQYLIERRFLSLSYSSFFKSHMTRFATLHFNFL